MNSQTSRHFEGLLDRYFETFLRDMPTAATAAGVRAAEGKLGDLGPEFHARREWQRRGALKALEALSPRELLNEQHLDRLALRNLLLKESEDFARNRHGLEPNAPEVLLSAVLRELLRGDDEPARAARNLRSLLKQAPTFLESAATALKTPERVWLGVMHETVAGAGALMDAAQKFLQLPQARPRSSDGALTTSALKAIYAYRDRAGALPAAPASSFALGAEALQRRIRDDLGLDYTLGQVEALAKSEVQRIEKLLAAACKTVARGKSPGQVLATARERWIPAKPLLELYRDETARVAKAFRAARAVTFPTGDSLVVKPVPEFLRAVIATAAYDPPGAFETRQRGVFWVNDLGLYQADPQQQLAERRQHFGIPLTCAHEAYPGHHLQFVTANRHPRKWRRLFAHAVFYEGWTLWCEQMAIDLKVAPDPLTRIQQLHDALWRCHRIWVDLRLQTGRYSVAQGMRHLQHYLGFTRARSEAEINWYTSQPGVPMSYWLGRLENERLHGRLVCGRGWSLQKFNDWLLGFGTLPQAWIEKYGLD